MEGVVVSWYRGLFPVLVLFAASGRLLAAEIQGKVSEVNGDTILIQVDGDLLPNVGDKVEVYFRIPGIDDPCHVADGTVAEVKGDGIVVKLGEGAAKAKAGHLVRVVSEHPRKREATEGGDVRANVLKAVANADARVERDHSADADLHRAAVLATLDDVSGGGFDAAQAV